jgi:hypothetical protein
MQEATTPVKAEPFNKVTTPKAATSKNAKLANAQARMVAPAAMEMAITMSVLFSIEMLLSSHLLQLAADLQGQGIAKVETKFDQSILPVKVKILLICH